MAVEHYRLIKLGGDWKPVRMLAHAEGFVMVQHGGGMPFVIHAGEWNGQVRCDKDGAELPDDR